MISSMRFTGYGFFTIDYSLLCGFISGIVAYLVVFIQFYALTTGDDKFSQRFN